MHPRRMQKHSETPKGLEAQISQVYEPETTASLSSRTRSLSFDHCAITCRSSGTGVSSTYESTPPFARINPRKTRSAVLDLA